ncbi:hypothetical protein PhiZZ30_147 [Serratia phage PhiZZ30]|uniref:Uncharacterized protein n=1 Tax=Serratia phage PhiZZ30 TaxID=2716729 RepID=A0A6G8R8U9_9CAUD|nr:hypothetical protein KMC30_gp266 [Serratia phage PhiZZ30]QIN97808.1 hypothetical protein PhiZZ30_147 [Serratia phage PhiZZ30]
MKLIKSGGTRWVLLTRKYAIKFPIPKTWKYFVQGMLSNLTEGQWKGYDNKHLCPIAYSNRFGLMVVMHKAEPVEDKELFKSDLQKLYNDVDGDECRTLDRDFFEYDAFPKNFGYYKGRLVKIDYGV